MKTKNHCSLVDYNLSEQTYVIKVALSTVRHNN